MRSGFFNRVLGKVNKVDKDSLLDFLNDIADEMDLLALIFDLMIEGLLFVDENETIRFANRRSGELFDLIPVEILGREISQVVLNKELLAAIRSVLRTGDPIEERLPLVIQGKQTILRIDIVPVRDRNGRFGGVLVLLLDITKEIQREIDLQDNKRLRALADFSASLAHEIRNPLNSIAIHVQIIERQMKKEGLTHLLNNTQIIRDEIRNLNEKLTGFLDAARPRQPQFEQVSVHDLMEQTLKLVRPELEQSGVAVEYYPPKVHITVFADPVDLKKAFVNIIRNSLEAMSSGGKLTIRIESDHPAVFISFQDNGSGISKEIRDRIFDLGFTTKQTGSGLGLSQVDRCVREHYGSITVENPVEGGTIFTIRLPIFTQGRQLLKHIADIKPSTVDKSNGDPAGD